MKVFLFTIYTNDSIKSIHTGLDQEKRLNAQEKAAT
jgi:hypothetical protein